MWKTLGVLFILTLCFALLFMLQEEHNAHMETKARLDECHYNANPVPTKNCNADNLKLIYVSSTDGKYYTINISAVSILDPWKPDNSKTEARK